MSENDLELTHLRSDFAAVAKLVAESVPQNFLQASGYLEAATKQLQQIGNAQMLISAHILPAMEAVRAAVSLGEQTRKALESLNASLPTQTESDHIQKMLVDSGYGFTNDIIEWSFARSLRTSTTGGHASARLTPHFLAMLRTSRSRQYFDDLFSSYAPLRKRKELVMGAYDAFMERRHHLAAPVLMSQFEGLISDLLVLNRDMKRKGTRLAVLIGGKTKMDKRGRVVYAIGLGDKVPMLRTTQEGAQEAAAHLTNKMIKERNAIFHGSKVRYPAAKLCVQSLIMLTIFGEAIEKELTTR